MEDKTIKSLEGILLDSSNSLPVRYRALFSLKHLACNGSVEAIDTIAKAFTDDSALLKHELAYCLGQTKNEYCIPLLQKQILDRVNQPDIVRHECAEALGAIASNSCLEFLKLIRDDPSESQVMKQTCELAYDRIIYYQKNPDKHRMPSNYTAVDPAPPLESFTHNEDVDSEILKLDNLLKDQNKPLFLRYQAIFRLRDIGTSKAIDALGSSLLDDPSTLLRHEIGFVFGQMGNEESAPYLKKSLETQNEADIVRHEAAEALGSITNTDLLPLLHKYSTDEALIVGESCKVAIDMLNHELSNEKEYAIIPETA